MSKNSSQLSTTGLPGSHPGHPQVLRQRDLLGRESDVHGRSGGHCPRHAASGSAASATTSPVTPAAGNGAAPVVSVHA